jgi:hypothetical protein
MAWNEIDLFDGKIVNMVYGGLFIYGTLIGYLFSVCDLESRNLIFRRPT